MDKKEFQDIVRALEYRKVADSSHVLFGFDPKLADLVREAHDADTRLMEYCRNKTKDMGDGNGSLPEMFACISRKARVTGGMTDHDYAFRVVSQIKGMIDRIDAKLLESGVQ